MSKKRVILIKEEIEDLFKEIDTSHLPFSLEQTPLKNIDQLFFTFRNYKDSDFVVVLSKKIYFNHLKRFHFLFEKNKYSYYPVFLVIAVLFSEEEIDMILEKHNLFYIPDLSPRHLVGTIKNALLSFHNRKKETNYIIDTFRSQMHLELFKREREKNQALVEKITKQSGILEAMYEFSNVLNSKGNLEDILESIVAMIKKFTGCQRISIMLIDEKQEFLVLKKATGIPPHIIGVIQLQTDKGLAGKVFREGKMLIMNDEQQNHTGNDNVDIHKIMGFPLVIIPLIEHETKLGILNITNRIDNTPFADEDIEVLSSIAHASAIAINNQLNKIKLEETFLGMTKAMVRAIEAKDPYTRGHSDRVVELSLAVGDKLKLPAEAMKRLQIAAILHDIGKIGIPGTILRNPKKLTGDQFQKSREHPLIGDRILAGIKPFEEIRKIIRHHHEHIDGSGYPDGLQGAEIPFEARIIAVVDAFDAMYFDRPYRKSLPFPETRKELKRVQGTQLDEECVAALLQYLEENKDKYR